MEKRYWIGRKRAAMSMARNATTAEVRLIHYELAGRYSIKAAHCLPFAIAAAVATEDGREALRPAAALPLPFGQPHVHAPAGETRS